MKVLDLLLLVFIICKNDVLHHVNHALLVCIVLVFFRLFLRVNRLIAVDNRRIRIKPFLLVILGLLSRRLQAAIQLFEIGDRLRDQLDVWLRFAGLYLFVRRSEHLGFLLLR